MNYRNLTKLMILMCSVIPASAAIAVASGAAQPPAPLTIEAVSSELNRNTGVATFTGNVIFDQGETHLRSNRLDVSFDNHNKITRAKATGQLAKYWNTVTGNSKTSGSNSTANKGMQAQAETIIYYPAQHKVELIGHAKATQNKDTMEAPYIEYHSDTGYLVSKATSQMRTRIVLYPTQKAVAPTSSGPKQQRTTTPAATALKFTAEKTS